MFYKRVKNATILSNGSGKALNFDGTDDYVLVPDDPSLDFGTGDFTISWWFNIDAYPPTETKGAYFFDTRASGETTNKYATYIKNQKMTIYHTTSSEFLVSNETISLSRWYHVEVVRSDGGTNNVKLYINGKYDNQATDTNSFTAANLFMGTRYTLNTDEFLNGRMDEVRIWNVALPADTIRKYMCRKVTSSHGYWSNLKGYWRMDDGSGYTTADGSANSNTGTLGTGSEGDAAEPSWVTSGASIGDASANDYSSPFSVNLAHSDGDDITIDNLSGSPNGVQVYRVDSAPNVTTVPSGSGWDKLDPLRYWGTFIIGGSSPTYTVTYDYGGHPGIQTEANLRLAKRDNGADGTWEDTGVTQSGGKLTKTDESGTEYILGTTSSDNSLPVELTSFTARQERDFVVLEWVTESEIENLGFIVERRHTPPFGYPSQEGNEEWAEIASYKTHPELQGQGSVTHRTEYQFVDSTVEVGKTYNYNLADVSYDGKVEYHGLTTLIVEAFEPLPDRLAVYQNYPNPFNAQTIISYYLPNDANVTVAIYDLTGRKLETLVSASPTASFRRGRMVSGRHKVKWDASNVASGIYIYRVSIGFFGETEHNAVAKKLVLLK